MTAAYQRVLQDFQQQNPFPVDVEDRVEAPNDMMDDSLGQCETISNSELLDLAQLDNSIMPNFEWGTFSSSVYGTTEAAIPTDNSQDRTGGQTDKSDTGDERHNFDDSLFLNFDQFKD